MQRGFGGGVFEPVQEEILDRVADPREKEITLGGASLLMLGIGLFGLCSLCFGLGYAAGHRSPLEPEHTSVASADQPSADRSLRANQVKPSAAFGTTQAAAAATAEAGSTPASQSDDSGVAVPVAGAQQRSDSGTQEPVMRTSLTTAPAAGVQPGSAGATAEPALAQSGVMVQIASVAHAEDADVLVSALRKRGYAVSAHRDPMDGLLHVQVGPFPGRADALVMRQKLLNDGYNAVVE